MEPLPGPVATEAPILLPLPLLHLAARFLTRWSRS